jgi:cytochrome c oxidase accessory protein FixG
LEQNTTYRDSVATIDEQGKRKWIFPKMPKGKFYDRRKALSYLLLLILLATPYLKIGGQPVLMLNILERKFVIFGQIFWPQDLHLFALTMLVFILFIIVFTIVFGRLFCGWVCPQTIFMEMVFRRIEYAIEGDWAQQKRLKKLPWNREKLLKKGTKNLIFWFISFLIANTFLSYIISYEVLWNIILDKPQNHIAGLISIIIFTTVFYLVFSKFREQVCTVVCPYGRLQDVLLDKNSLVVIYDKLRGEKRGKIAKGENREDAKKGDCIDCNQCVNVCPTGIDIRNGTQLECVNCTACMDACDDMMEKVNLPKNLIRYDSINGIENKEGFKITTRVKAYIVVLFVLFTILVSMLFTRSEFETTILRTRGTIFQEVSEGVYSNIYDVSVLNKSNNDLHVDIKVLEGNAKVQMIGDNLVLKAQSESQGKFMLLINEEDFTHRKMNLVLGIYSDNELIEKVETTFITPTL